MIVVTFAVTVNDFVQAQKVIKLLWTSGHILKGIDGKNFTNTGLIPSSIFLTMVMIFSSLHIVFNLHSLWYRFKVARQMEKPRGIKTSQRHFGLFEKW